MAQKYNKQYVLIGRRIGRLIVDSLYSRSINQKGLRFTCICDCGNTVVVASQSLHNKVTKSCGCLNRELILERAKTHGMTKTRTYGIYYGMRRRCLNPEEPCYGYYGGRGISVCDRWLESFENFLSDMGEAPIGKQIDRINNDGNYEPTNCRWVTRTENARNKSNTVVYEFNGKKKTIVEWAEELGIKSGTLRARIRVHKLPLHQALSAELIHQKDRKNHIRLAEFAPPVMEVRT